ncbi:MBL fold metallo-hydrolase [uncultured Megasphaera sp.]|uniref:MBL fold metallo-hydrolase n=1 Tax=uncultured Megasphaera sp. TaxID=165188 RepID=UPI00262A2092|nr:hypothetical protein [uncultured Megasphaera sp.]
MKCTLVGNAGIYLRDRKHSILIDSLYGGNEFFNQKPSEVCCAAEGKGNLFRNTDVLLFTHRHEDHFSSRYVNNYLKNNEVRHVYVPDVSGNQLEYEDTGIIRTTKEGVRVITVGQKGEAIFYDKIYPDSWVIFFKTKHMGNALFDVPHYSIALVLNGSSYLFMGDTDWSYPVRNIRNMLSQTQLKSIFINPLSYADRRRRQWLRELGCPQVLLYHIPFADDDVSGIRQLTNLETDFYQLKEGYALKENRQTVFIN